MIMNDDEDMLEHISPMDLINQFKKFEPSLKKFKISEDDFFEKLSIKNKEIERFEMHSKTFNEDANGKGS